MVSNISYLAEMARLLLLLVRRIVRPNWRHEMHKSILRPTAFAVFAALVSAALTSATVGAVHVEAAYAADSVIAARTAAA